MSSPRGILVVEDDENDFLLIECAIKAAGIILPVRHSRTAQEAIDYLSGNPSNEDRSGDANPQIVFLDLHLSTTSGLEVLTWMRTHQKFKATVVIVLSASSHPEDVSRAYRLGANSYMTKPSSTEQFVTAMVNFRRFWLETNQFAASGYTISLDSTTVP